jgi:alkylation response protein AidB-like acyl-CoA dehydrogenase
MTWTGRCARGSRRYADARVSKIFGGTNEIMKELISRFL